MLNHKSKCPTDNRHRYLVCSIILPNSALCIFSVIHGYKGVGQQFVHVRINHGSDADMHALAQALRHDTKAQQCHHYTRCGSLLSQGGDLANDGETHDPFQMPAEKKYHPFVPGSHLEGMLFHHFARLPPQMITGARPSAAVVCDHVPS